MTGLVLRLEACADSERAWASPLGGSDSPVVALAGETRELLAVKLGAGPFARICGQLEAQAAGRRAERKAAVAVQVRVPPVRAQLTVAGCQRPGCARSAEDAQAEASTRQRSIVIRARQEASCQIVIVHVHIDACLI